MKRKACFYFSKYYFILNEWCYLHGAAIKYE